MLVGGARAAVCGARRAGTYAPWGPRDPSLSQLGSPTIQAWVDAVEAQLDAAGFEQPDIAGNSLGGWLALELAKRGRVRSVVGVAPAGLFTRDEGRAFAKKFRRDHRTSANPPAAGASRRPHTPGKTTALRGRLRRSRACSRRGG